MKRLSTRMILFILVPTMLFFVVMIGFVSLTVNRMVTQDAEQILASHGESLANELRLELETALRSAETLSQSFLATIEQGLIPTREKADVMLQQVLENNAHYYTTWMYWEPNAFDGRDQEYIYAKGHDHTGQYMPVWSRSGDGYHVEPLEISGDFEERLKTVLETGKNAIFEPYWYLIDNEQKLVASIVAPVVLNGKTIGVTGIDFTLDDFARRIDEYRFYDNGFAGLMTNQGNVIAHQNKDLIGKNYFESAAMMTHPELNRVVEAVRMGQQVQIDGFSEALQTDVYRLFTPIHLTGTDTPWSAFLAAPINEVMEQANQLSMTILVVSGAVSVILLVIILWVTRMIVTPIKQAVEHGHEMASGDFTRRVPEKFLKRDDEIGALAKIFAVLCDNMRELIGKVQESTRLVLDSAETMEVGAQQATAATHQVATSIDEVARSAEAQMQNAEESAKSMEEMAQGIQTVANSAAAVSDAANSMTEQARTGHVTLENAVEQMNHIQSETIATKKMIETLQEGTNKIADIVSIITDISAQTNLLALNAAIEAARVGEAGKGFAVVADEVRKLADDTKNSAAEIEQLVQIIKADSDRVAQSINESETQVNLGIERMKEVDLAFAEINRSVRHVTQEIEALSAVAEEMSAGSEEVAATSQEIASSAEMAFSHTQQVAAASEEQLASMQEMEKTSETLKSLANQLDDLLKQFKVS